MGLAVSFVFNHLVLKSNFRFSRLYKGGMDNTYLFIGNSRGVNSFYQPEQKKDDLNSTDDRKPTEESHGAPNETQLGLRLDLLVSLDVVKGGRVKVDLHQLEG